jgi:flagellar biosynthesis protein FlhF
MRLRSFTAPTLAEAMQLVRDALGPDALIVSTHPGGRGGAARVTAAIESPEETLERGDSDLQLTSAAASALDSPGERAHRTIRDAFEFHGVPAVLARRLGGLAGDALAASADGEDPIVALAAALDGRFRFAPLSDLSPRARPIIVVGPPGAGKTATVAKLATRAVLAGRRVGVISTDTVRAGAIEQLSAFTRLLELDIQVAEDPGALADAVLATRGAGGKLDQVLIDTAGVNPYDDDELASLTGFVEAAAAEVVLVLPAGGDALEAAEIGAAFATVGAKRLLTTRLDTARRLGGLLTAAEAGKFAFAEVGTTSHVAEGLAPLNPVSLARLLLGAPVPAAQAAPQPLGTIKAVS